MKCNLGDGKCWINGVDVGTVRNVVVETKEDSLKLSDGRLPKVMDADYEVLWE
mgnify:CR=1 FL=1